MNDLRKVGPLAALLILLTLTGTASAAGKLGADEVAVVNKVAITKGQLDHVMKLAVSQGQADTPELRELAKQDLIERQLLVQSATKLSLDKTPEAKEQMEIIRTSFLVELSLKDYQAKHPITDADLKREYDRQLGLMGNTADLKQYRVSHMLLGTEERARDVVARVGRGESFNAIAQQESSEKSAGIVSDWLLPSQLGPEVTAGLLKLEKGGVSAAPIRVGAGWLLIKLEDRRQFMAPTFEESKVNLRATLMREMQAELVRQLRDAAQIVQ